MFREYYLHALEKANSWFTPLEHFEALCLSSTRYFHKDPVQIQIVFDKQNVETYHETETDGNKAI